MHPFLQKPVEERILFLDEAATRSGKSRVALEKDVFANSVTDLEGNGGLLCRFATVGEMR